MSSELKDCKFLMIIANVFAISVVLMDPEKRAIYDTLGTEGLQEAQQNGTHSMELVTRYRTPMEIREEFERLQRYVQITL